MPRDPAARQLVAYQLRHEIDRTRQLIADACELLRQSPPDTFLGRPRHELALPDAEQDTQSPAQ